MRAKEELKNTSFSWVMVVFYETIYKMGKWKRYREIKSGNKTERNLTPEDVMFISEAYIQTGEKMKSIFLTKSAEQETKMDTPEKNGIIEISTLRMNENEKRRLKFVRDHIDSLLEGREIEFEHTSNVWMNALMLSAEEFCCYGSAYRLRVKKKEEYRPYTLEELKTLINQRVTDSTGFPHKVLGIDVQYKPGGEYIFVHIDSFEPLTPQELLETNMLYNGKPCGVEVAE